MTRFSDVKKQVLECLNSGHVLHEARGKIDVKNLLATGEVSTADVACVLGRSRGNEYESSKYHSDSSIDVHIVKKRYLGVEWYIKWYFMEPDTVFISVHHQE